MTGHSNCNNNNIRKRNCRGTGHCCNWDNLCELDAKLENKGEKVIEEENDYQPFVRIKWHSVELVQINWHRNGLAQKGPDLTDCNILYLQQRKSQLICLSVGKDMDISTVTPNSARKQKYWIKARSALKNKCIILSKLPKRHHRFSKKYENTRSYGQPFIYKVYSTKQLPKRWWFLTRGICK